MKVIFLDIDGVLNKLGQTPESRTKEQIHGAIGLEMELVRRFNTVVYNTGARVVISSSWRYWDEGMEHVRAKVIGIIGETPRLRAEKRGEEVKRWLNETDQVIEKYVILDDDSDFLEGQPLIQTETSKGFTEKVAQKVRDALN